ncbi:Structural maintenance of chromosomes protein 1 [Metarhizium acridum]|nr:Structural maintenance of chromosomes protein 1 [Metarhizium acridum]
MDAISFVLGIKSSHLRSAHLKDLVYRGRVLRTSKINDDGSADTQDNSDVATTTGDDKAPEAILKPPGSWQCSLEYKTEYEKLQADAEEAAENQNFQLHRRRGINSEIKQYREQKKEADSFQKKTEEERDAAIVSHCLWKLYHFQKAMDESSTVEDARRDQNTAGRLVARTEKEIKLRQRNIEDKENALLPFDEKVHESSQQVEKLHAQSQKVAKERDEQAAIVEKVRKDIENVKKAQSVFEEDTKEQMRKQGRDISDTDRKEYNLLRAEVMSRSGTNQAKLENLERQRKADEVTVNNLRGKLDSITAAIEKAEAELQNIGERRSSTEAASKEIADEIARKKKEFNQLQSERVRTNQKRTELEEKLEDVARKLREADDGRRQNDRETRMKEMVTSLKRMFPGVRGRIGDLCTPKQKKYDEAVIVALGKDFDSVVVDTEKVGIDCVQYLKEQRFPPMTFIPLDNIKVNAVNTAIKGFSGARLTIDTINFDTSVERAVSYACGSSVVCDSLSIAKHICYDKKIPVKAVTLEGYIIHKAGLMTGGRGPEPKGGKRKFEEIDVQNLQRMAMKLKDEIDRLPKSDRRGTQEESLQIDLAGLERRLVSMKEELAAFGKNWTSKKRELDGFKKELRDLEPKYKEQLSQLETDNATLSEFRAAIARVEDEVFANFCRRLGYSDIRAYDASQGKLEQEVSEKGTSLRCKSSGWRTVLNGR